MPKAGSTALQLFLSERYDALRARGIVFPKVGVEDDPWMRHHWMINALLLDDSASFEARMKLVAEECDASTHTIILSSEAFFAHVAEFRPEPRRWLGELRRTYDVTTWLWLREPVAFCRSWYLQALQSPHVESFPAYGRDVSVSQFLDMPWVAGQFDYAERCREIEAMFDPGSLFAFAHGSDIVAEACSLLDIDDLYLEKRENVSWMHETSVTMLRLVNRFDLDSEEKRLAPKFVRKIARLVGNRAPVFEMSASDAERVRALGTMDVDAIERVGETSRRRWAAEKATA